MISSYICGVIGGFIVGYSLAKIISLPNTKRAKCESCKKTMSKMIDKDGRKWVSVTRGDVYYVLCPDCFEEARATLCKQKAQQLRS